MQIKHTKPYFTIDRDPNGDDTGYRTFIVRASKRTARRMVRTAECQPGWFTTRMAPALERELLDRGLIEPYGCDCGHCRAGWDCCGCLFPSIVRAERVRGGVRITQHYYRNI